MIVRKKMFKAWDKVKKKVIFDKFHIIGETTAFDLIGQYRLENLNDIVVLEYLNDKICEGDIVKFKQRYAEENYGIGVVEWDERELQFVCKQLPTYATINTYLPIYQVKTIGNIYENEKHYFKLLELYEKKKTGALDYYNTTKEDVEIEKIIKEMQNKNRR